MIKLTQKDIRNAVEKKLVFFVNPVHIVSLTPTGDERLPTTVAVAGGGRVPVYETVQEIVEKIMALEVARAKMAASLTAREIADED